MKATEEVKREALAYYLENAFGYDSVRDYVETDYGWCMDAAEQRKLADYIKRSI